MSTLATPNVTSYRTQDHSWFGRCVHILRSNGNISRAIIRDMNFKAHGIYFTAEIKCGGKSTRKKDVDAITIACIQLLWLNIDVVSESDSEEENVLDQCVQECSNHLPLMSVSPETFQTFNRDQKLAFSFLSMQIASIINITSKIHPMDIDSS